jgi:hypothetical protein
MTNDQAAMTNESQGREPERPTFDLAERTARFGEAIIEFCLNIDRNAVTKPIISQLVRSGTSIGANYGEADEAGSKKEFRYRISLFLFGKKPTNLPASLHPSTGPALNHPDQWSLWFGHWTFCDSFDIFR